MNSKNNSLITNNSNKAKNTSIIEKLKNIKLQLSKYNLSKEYLFNNNKYNSKNNKPINKPIIKQNNNNNINKINYCIPTKTNKNSPKKIPILINKEIKVNKNKNLKLNNSIFHSKNNSMTNRSFENRKYKKLKNKTPEISRVSSTRFNKNNAFKYKYLKQNNNININKNKKYGNLNIKIKTLENKLNQTITHKKNNINISVNKKYEKKKNNSMEVRTNKHLNIFTDYLKGSKTALKNKYVQNNLIGISNCNNNSINKSKMKYYSITPINNYINNSKDKSSKKQNESSPNSIYYSIIHNNKSKMKNSNINTQNNSFKTNKDSIKYKNNENLSFYLGKHNKINIYNNYKTNLNNGKIINKKNRFFPTSVNSSLYLESNLNIKVQSNNTLNIEKEKEKTKKKNNHKITNLKTKIKQILSQSQQEITKIKETFVKHFTNKNSPKKNKATKASIRKKYKNTKNIISSKNKNNKINTNKKNKEKNNNNKIIHNPNKEKINGQINHKKIEDLKNGLLINGDNSNLKTSNNIYINDTIQNDNYYLNESIKLTNYIKGYYRLNKTYPKTNLNFYKYGRMIGQGSFGKVNIGLNVLSGRIVAIKSFDKEKIGKNSDNMKKIIYESNLMKKLNHPNITKILEMFEDEKYFLIIMEYINGGNLFSFVKKRRKLSEKTAKFLFRQIILGIQHMHSKNIVHRDIKLENILIDLNNNVKICDFGIGLVLNSLNDKLYDHCGTPMYMAPEILLANKNIGTNYIGPPVDVWSAGISLYIMLSGNLPFDIKDISDEVKNGKYFNGEYNDNILLQYCILKNEPKKIDDISDLAQNLLKRILNKNPKKRMTCEEILNDPWLYFDDNHKYHLFTKAEMIMLSKTFIDYRYSKSEDLIETFTISNLIKETNKTNKDKNTDNNIDTKSSIFTPYNSAVIDLSIKSNKNSDKELDLNDVNNSKIKFKNNSIIYSNKAKELNMIYELNNNEEIDNGVLINSKTNSTSSNKLNNSKDNDYMENINNKWFINNKNKNMNKNIKENKKYILDSIESMGYDKKYAINIINNNELSQVYAIYFLLNNYDKI